MQTSVLTYPTALSLSWISYCSTNSLHGKVYLPLQDKHMCKGLMYNYFNYLDPQRLYSSAPQLKKTMLLFGLQPVLPFSPRTRATFENRSLSFERLCPTGKQKKGFNDFIQKTWPPPSSEPCQSQGQEHRSPTRPGGCPS